MKFLCYYWCLVCFVMFCIVLMIRLVLFCVKLISVMWCCLLMVLVMVWFLFSGLFWFVLVRLDFVCRISLVDLLLWMLWLLRVLLSVWINGDWFSVVLIWMMVGVCWLVLVLLDVLNLRLVWWLFVRLIGRFWFFFFCKNRKFCVGCLFVWFEVIVVYFFVCVVLFGVVFFVVVVCYW